MASFAKQRWQIERIVLGAPVLTVPTGFDIGMWGLDVEGVCAGQQHWASAAESLGFVVRMPVILLLARFSLSSIYRAVFTPGWEDSGEDRWHPAVDQQKQHCGLRWSPKLLTKKQNKKNSNNYNKSKNKALQKNKKKH